MIKFSPANSKLKKLAKKTGRKVYSFDLLSGHTCPAAKDCLAKTVYDWDEDSYSLVDGPPQQFRCYSASQENQYSGVYNLRLANWEGISELKGTNKIAAALSEAMPDDAETIRIHSSGDFFRNDYFLAWVLLAKRHPEIIFYAYTKMNVFWVRHKGLIPPNMILTASRGGKFDNLIDEHGLREVKVVYSDDEVKASGLELDDDDSHAADPDNKDKSYLLMIHANGPAGSMQARVHSNLRKKV